MLTLVMLNSCHVISCHVNSCLVNSCHVNSGHVNCRYVSSSCHVNFLSLFLCSLFILFFLLILVTPHSLIPNNDSIWGVDAVFRNLNKTNIYLSIQLSSRSFYLLIYLTFVFVVKRYRHGKSMYTRHLVVFSWRQE